MIIKFTVQVVYIVTDIFFEWSTFAYVTMEVVSHYAVIIFPISYMLWCHHCIYKL